MPYIESANRTQEDIISTLVVSSAEHRVFFSLKLCSYRGLSNMFKHYLPSFVFDCANTFEHILHSITRGMNSPFFYWPSKPQPPLLQILCRRRTTESGYAGGCTSFLTTRSDQQDHTRFPLNMCVRCCIFFSITYNTLPRLSTIHYWVDIREQLRRTIRRGVYTS